MYLEICVLLQTSFLEVLCLWWWICLTLKNLSSLGNLCCILCATREKNVSIIFCWGVVVPTIMSYIMRLGSMRLWVVLKCDCIFILLWLSLVCWPETHISCWWFRSIFYCSLVTYSVGNKNDGQGSHQDSSYVNYAHELIFKFTTKEGGKKKH